MCPTATSDDSLLQMANSADESVALDTESRMSSNKSELNISEWDVRTAYVKSEIDNFLSKAALNSEPGIDIIYYVVVAYKFLYYLEI